MTTQRKTSKNASDKPRKAPTKAERKDTRGHSQDGNVRPADGRWGLHKPKDESKVIRTEKEGDPNA